MFCSIAHRTLKRRGGRFPRCLKQSRAPLPVDMGRRAQRRALEILVPRPHKTQMQNRETKQNTNTQKRQTHAKPRAPQRSLSPIVTHTQGINTQGTHTHKAQTHKAHTHKAHTKHTRRIGICEEGGVHPGSPSLSVPRHHYKGCRPRTPWSRICNPQTNDTRTIKIQTKHILKRHTRNTQMRTNANA